MEIYLIRHTEVAVGRRVAYGQTDVALADNFAEQRDRLRALLPAQPSLLFSSPLSRCRQLADALAADTNLVVETDRRLLELHFGDWENQPWAAIPPTELDPWMADFTNLRPPNGENFQDLADRVGAFWHDLARMEQSAEGPVFIVTHAGVIRAWLCLFLGLPLSNAFRIHLDYGSLTKVALTGSAFSVQFINR
ncbi:MAG: alpha-ribazole phosphatase [Bacteroidetes bacterium]|nr:alpha-ribazole phosphatase [Fibrella sp.]